MSRKYFIYPNCSKGGVSAVLRGRASRELGTRYTGIFTHDRGGRKIYDDYLNVDVRIVRPDRLNPYLHHVMSQFGPDEVAVLSKPDVLQTFDEYPDPLLAYEIHSSDMNIVQTELAQLNPGRLDELRVPSEYMHSQVSAVAPPRLRRIIKTVRNVVDETVFRETGDDDFFELSADPLFQSDIIPLVWVGRFDKGKGYRQFLRALALLPPQFVGIFVVSLEADPGRTVHFLSEAYSMGVSSRVRVFNDLQPAALARLFRTARRSEGALVSTSLQESFGYSVAEALACGLRVRVFDLPVWVEHGRFAALGTAVPAGDVRALANAIV